MLTHFIKLSYIGYEQIIDKKINQGDSQIKIIGKLLDFATEEETEKYYGSKIIKSDNIEQTEESNFII